MSRIYRALEKAGKEHKSKRELFPGVLEEDSFTSKPGVVLKDTEERGSDSLVPFEDQLSISLAPSDSFSSEQFRKLKTHIFRCIPQPRSLLITSCAPEEGKTMVSLNLALAISQEIQKRTILIDADLRKPDIFTEKFDHQKGLSDYLADQTPLTEVLRNVETENFMVIPGGTPTQRAAELINSNKLKELLKNFNEFGDNTYVIIDSPPILSASESLCFPSGWMESFWWSWLAWSPSQTFGGSLIPSNAKRSLELCSTRKI